MAKATLQSLLTAVSGHSKSQLVNKCDGYQPMHMHVIMHVNTRTDICTPVVTLVVYRLPITMEAIERISDLVRPCSPIEFKHPVSVD